MHSIEDTRTKVLLKKEEKKRGKNVSIRGLCVSVCVCVCCVGTHQASPEGISIGLEHFVVLFLCQIDQEGGQDQAQEANVPGRD